MIKRWKNLKLIVEVDITIYWKGYFIYSKIGNVTVIIMILIDEQFDEYKI